MMEGNCTSSRVESSVLRIADEVDNRSPGCRAYATKIRSVQRNAKYAILGPWWRDVHRFAHGIRKELFLNANERFADL
jgi:hypothetical protein